MLLTKPLRRCLSSWLVLAVLFTQLATAAYVCPVMGAAAEHGADASTDMAGMPCAEMMAGAAVALDADQPGLCMQHCQSGSQAVDASSPVSIPAPAPLPVLMMRVPEPASVPLTALAAQRRSRDNAPPLPHSIDHCCYRI